MVFKSHVVCEWESWSESRKKTNKAERNGERHWYPFNFIIHLDFIADVEQLEQKEKTVDGSEWNKWKIYGRKIMQLISCSESWTKLKREKRWRDFLFERQMQFHSLARNLLVWRVAVGGAPPITRSWFPTCEKQFVPRCKSFTTKSFFTYFTSETFTVEAFPLLKLFFLIFRDNEGNAGGSNDLMASF